MRVAVITTSYPAHEEDASGHFVHAEVQALLRRGCEVTLLLPRASAACSSRQLHVVPLPHLGLFGWPGALARLRSAPFRLLGALPFAHNARGALRHSGPFDAIVAHWIVPSFWPIAHDLFAQNPSSSILSAARDNDSLLSQPSILSAARDNGPTITVVVHGSDARLLERLPRPLRRRILVALGRPEVHVRCVSTELATLLSRLAEAEKCTLERVKVEPCAVDIPTLPVKSEQRRALGLSSAPLVVVVGRVVQTKQIDLAIEATVSALGYPPTVIGDGPERPALMRRFPEARWLGQRPRNETLRWVRAADLLVSASPKEGAPTVIREALALGTKVVALDCGDLKQWAENDRNLVVVAHEGNANTVAQPKALRVQGVNEPPPTAVSADIPETPRPERPATRHFEPYSVKAGLVDAIRECLDQAAPPRLRF